MFEGILTFPSQVIFGQGNISVAIFEFTKFPL